MKKNKVLIIVFLLSIIILTTIISVTFSKYAIERKDTHILESDAFYFNSSLTQQEYQLNEWNGKDVQNIKFNVKNYLDNMQITEQDIKYDMKAQITNEDAQLVNLELKDENGSIVTTKEESDTENTTFTVSGLTLKADTTAEQILTTNNYSISISPKNSELEEGKIINVKLEISSTEPYTKEITSNIKLTVHTVSNYVGNIIESDNYNDLNYKLTLNGDYTSIFSNTTYPVNSSYINNIVVNSTATSTVITFSEKKIMTVLMSEADGYIYIKPVLPKERYSKIIVLDAGHGGSDPGASGNGLIEKNLTLSMLNKARALFDSDGTIKCYATRTTDTYPSFNDRTDLGNDVGDAFISIHINAAANTSAAGTETYSLYANDQGNGLTSYGLASEILKNLLSQLGTKDRKVKSENWIVLRQSKIPASLIEIGFITNSGDAAIMGSDAGQQKVAQAIFDSVKNLFNQYPPVR